MRTGTHATRKPILCRDTGGIPFRILLVVLTLILVGGSIYLLLENQKRKNKVDHRKATEFCDYGLQLVMEQLLQKINTNEPVSGIEKTNYDGGWYKVLVTTSRSDSLLELSIQSIGGCGKQTVDRKEKVALYRSLVEGDSLWVPRMQR